MNLTISSWRVANGLNFGLPALSFSGSVRRETMAFRRRLQLLLTPRPFLLFPPNRDAKWRELDLLQA